MSGSDVVIVGGGVTGLSAGWWLARSGVKVTVLEKFIVGWEASGVMAAVHRIMQSPLFDEEQRMWPQMDELFGYPDRTSERPYLDCHDREAMGAISLSSPIATTGWAIRSNCWT
jgi:sarcosine oxidase, subunit beta